MHSAHSEVQEDGLVAEIGDRLHDLCQPLTALQCRLELCGMDREPAAMQRAIGEALRECERINVKVHAMQYALRGAKGQVVGRIWE